VNQLECLFKLPHRIAAHQLRSRATEVHPDAASLFDDEQLMLRCELPQCTVASLSHFVIRRAQEC
jgi:hypothetical protein